MHLYAEMKTFKKGMNVQYGDRDLAVPGVYFCN